MTAWPGSLPQSPLIDDMQEIAPHLVQRSAMDLGPAKQRPRFTVNVRKFSWGFIMSEAQVATLDDFYLNTCKRGAIQFTLAEPRTGSTLNFRFTTTPAYRQLSGNRYKVQLELETVPQSNLAPAQSPDTLSISLTESASIVATPVSWFYDNFTVSADANLDAHPPVIGISWSLVTFNSYTGTVKVDAAADYAVATVGQLNAGIACIANAVYLSSDYFVEADMLNTNLVGDVSWGLIVRWIDSSNYYSAYIQPSGNPLPIELRKVVAGVVTVLNTGTISHPSVVDFDLIHRFRLEVEGTSPNQTLGLYIDDVLYLSATDNALTATGKAAFGLGTACDHFNDDVSVEYSTDEFRVYGL